MFREYGQHWQVSVLRVLLASMLHQQAQLLAARVAWAHTAQHLVALQMQTVQLAIIAQAPHPLLAALQAQHHLHAQLRLANAVLVQLAHTLVQQQHHVARVHLGHIARLLVILQTVTVQLAVTAPQSCQ